MRIKIKALSQAETVPGQGVGSAAYEQKKLIRENLGHHFELFYSYYGKAELTHFHTINLSYYWKLIFRRRRTSRMIGYVHFLPETLEGSIKLPRWLRLLFYSYVTSFYRKLDQVVVVNPSFIEKLVRLKVKREKITYIPNVVNQEEFFKADESVRNRVRAAYNIPAEAFVVIGVGQLQTRKGVMEFIEIAKTMKDVYFLWAGGFSFKKLTDGYEQIKEAVEQAPANCRFPGIVERNQMNDLYNAADIFFLPSYAELFPMCILEAMNVGIPLLLRDVDLYEPILLGLYAAGQTNEEFIDLINRFRNERDFYQEYAAKSAQGAEKYSKENNAKQWDQYYLDSYRALIEKNKGRRQRKMREKLAALLNQ